jgi:EAL domain-containing protein (putative c-di-GMP-specific phosphodiesterase class I)
MPAAFIEIAERTGLILPIGDWVVSEACRTLDVLRSQGVPIPLSVNVSSLQVDTSQIVESIRKWTAFYGIAPQLLHVEITESGIMRDVEQAISVMMRLRELGVRIALDDFGAGYSSLSHLKSLPLDMMKVDMSLVHGLEHSERDRQIMTSVLQLARATDLSVIAEGVETAEQAQILRALGCGTLQGYYFSRPLFAAEFYEFVVTRTSANGSLRRADAREYPT